MSLNIPGSLLRYLTDIKGNFNLDRLSAKQKAMLKTYAKKGVIRTNGISGKIASYIRLTEGKQCVKVNNGAIKGYRIKDESIYEAITAAMTISKIRGGEAYKRYEPYICMSTRDGTLRLTFEEFSRDKPETFYIYMDNIHEHFTLTKLSDPLDIDPSGSMVLDLRKM